MKFELGMEFRNLVMFKQVVKDYSINARVKVKFMKNDAKQVRVKCEDPCPWVLMCLWSKVINSF